MKKMLRNGFTLIEVLVTVVIISVLALISIPQLLPMLKEFSLKDNTLVVGQTINEAKNLAIKNSSLVYMDFNQAGANHDNLGGLIQIKKSDGTVLSQVYLDKNVLFNGTQSSIQDKLIFFDYKGIPVDSTENADNFTSSNNIVAISIYSASMKVLNTRHLKIAPMTGKVQLQ